MPEKLSDEFGGIVAFIIVDFKLEERIRIPTIIITFLQERCFGGTLCTLHLGQFLGSGSAPGVFLDGQIFGRMVDGWRLTYPGEFAGGCL